MKARKRIAEGGSQCTEKCQQFLADISTFSKPPCLTQISEHKTDNHIWQNLYENLFKLLCVHRLCSLCFSRLMVLPGSDAMISLSFLICSRTLERSSLLNAL